MKTTIIALLSVAATACTYGNDAAVYKEVNYNYPPVGYVLQPQPAPQGVCPRNTVAQYQTFWTYDQNGRFNPTQQYVCAPGQGR